RVDGQRAPGRAGGRPAALFRFASDRLEVTDEFAALRPPRGCDAALARHVFEDLPPAAEEELVRVVDETKGCVREPRFEVAADRRRTHVGVLAPPERHRRPYVRELEAPRPAEVRKLPREPQTSVPERLHAAARV